MQHTPRRNAQHGRAVPERGPLAALRQGSVRVALPRPGMRTTWLAHPSRAVGPAPDVQVPLDAHDRPQHLAERLARAALVEGERLLDGRSPVLRLHRAAETDAAATLAAAHELRATDNRVISRKKGPAADSERLGVDRDGPPHHPTSVAPCVPPVEPPQRRTVAETLFGRARGAQLALIDGAPGAVWAPGGRPRAVFAFRVVGNTIAEIEVVIDPSTMAALPVVLL